MPKSVCIHVQYENNVAVEKNLQEGKIRPCQLQKKKKKAEKQLNNANNKVNNRD